MPAVLDTPEVMDYETYDLPEAHPRYVQLVQGSGGWSCSMYGGIASAGVHRTSSSRLSVHHV